MADVKEEKGKWQSMKAIITKKSHMFGLYTPIDKIYFDTYGHFFGHREASLTSGIDIPIYPCMGLSYDQVGVAETSRFKLTLEMDQKEKPVQVYDFPIRTFCPLLYAMDGYIDSRREVIRIHPATPKTFQVQWDTSAVDIDEAMDIAHYLIMYQHSPEFRIGHNLMAYESEIFRL